MVEHPITFAAIAPILKESAYNIQARGSEHVTISWYQLKFYFPELIFVESQFSYINPYNQKLTPISSLLGRSFFKTSDQKSSKFAVVRNQVNFLLNAKAELEKLTSVDYIQYYLDRMNSAIEKRIHHRKDHYAKFCVASDKICGYYYKSKMHYIIITNDPLDIFMKSTGRSWERESCERIGGSYEDGIFSDIEWCNLIAFIYNVNDANNPIARIMIRTCETSDGEPSFGIEPIWYTVRGKMDFNGAARLDGMLIKSASQFLISVIKQQGFDMDYERCNTEYVYHGYSDREQDGHTMISYGDTSPITIEHIIDSATLDRANKCPFCHLLNEWEITFKKMGTSAGNIIHAFDRRTHDIIDNVYIDSVNVERVDFNVYTAYGNIRSSYCGRCDAKMFYYLNDNKEKIKFKKLIPVQATRRSKIRFMNYDDDVKRKIIASQVEFQVRMICNIWNYTNLVKRLNAQKKTSDFIEFLMNHEMHKKSWLGIVIDNKWNYGEDIGDTDDDIVIVHVRSDLIDFNAIVKEYVEQKCPDALKEQLLYNHYSKDATKFKKFDKFCST